MGLAFVHSMKDMLGNFYNMSLVIVGHLNHKNNKYLDMMRVSHTSVVFYFNQWHNLNIKNNLNKLQMKDSLKNLDH